MIMLLVALLIFAVFLAMVQSPSIDFFVGMFFVYALACFAFVGLLACFFSLFN